MSFQRLLLYTVAERVFSAQETCHLLLELSLYYSSRQFVILNLNKESPRWLYRTGTENAMLYLRYKIYKGKWKNEFCRIKVILHVPHRSFQQLTENDALLWPELFNHNITEKEEEFKDLIGLSVDNLEVELDNYKEQQEAKKYSENIRPDWMILAEMGLNAIVDGSSDLGSHDQSRNEDDLSAVNSIVDYRSLNEKQMIIFRKIETHYNAIIANHNQVDPFRIAMNNGVETSPVIVFAPTGITAFNIYESIIHSTLSILVNTSNFDIEDERLKNLQKRLKVDLRLCVAFSEHQNQQFGGQSVILIGDFRQLSPVIDELMYAKKLKRDSLSNDGINIYSQLREVYQLDAVIHQSGDSPEQRLFRDILMRLHDGKPTIDDWRTLATCFDDSSTTENNQFVDAIHITP
ncbi:hypothetical protein RclHR1_16110003 [Rhizophagus clarus]|uniref:ATP-dependent DNA helicase n=1 Tax=Rhizophagus clarus TaxID=94130 RepID=A0A2Z6QUG0_9GLOM|nr:hypothetical protein RclHR1_16110003 [Rhizophagus clarus]